MDREAAIAALERLPSLAVVSLKPSDVLVVECKESISQESADQIRAMIRMVFPKHRVLICDDGTKIHVIDSSEAEDLPEDI